MAANLQILIQAVDRASATLGKISGSLTGLEKAGQAAAVGMAAATAATAALGAAAYKLGSSFDEAYDSIRVGTGATGAALDGLKDDFRAVVKDVPTDFAKAGQAIADLNTRTGATGPLLQKLTKQMLELSRLTKTDVNQNIRLSTRLFGDWGVAVDEQVDTLDKLFRATQTTGIGLDRLQETLVQYGAPLRQMGFSLDEATALLAKWEQEGVNAELVLGSLRIALNNFAEAGVDAPAALQALITKIRDMDDAAAAGALAAKVFGARAGPDMAAAIREGRFELGSLVDQIASGADTIEQAADDAEDFGDKWHKTMNKLALAFEGPATQAFDFASQMLDDLAPAIEEGIERGRVAIGKLGPAWAEMSDEAKRRILFVAALLVAGGPLIKGITIGVRGVQLLAAAFALLPGRVKIAIFAVAGAILGFFQEVSKIVKHIGLDIRNFGVITQNLPGFGHWSFQLMKAGQGLIDFGENIDNFKRQALTLDTVGEAINAVTPAFDDLLGRLDIAGREALTDAVAAMEEWTRVSNTAAGASDDWAGMIQNATDEAKRHEAALYEAGAAASAAGRKAREPWKPVDIDEVISKLGGAAKKAKEAGISVKDLVGALVSMHPATAAASAQVALWESRIAATNLALVANQDQLRAAQAELSRMGERLSYLNSRLSEAKQRLSDLSAPRLTGMGALDEQLFQLEQRMKRLQLAKLLGTAPADVDAQLEALRKQQDILRLRGELRYDEPLRRLKQAAEGVKPELSYAQALAAIQSTKAEISGLTGEIAAQEAAMRAQQGVVNSLQAAADALNRTLQEQQQQLQAAKEKQELVTQVLERAYNWYINDRAEITKLGAEGQRVAGVIDEKTRTLLTAMAGFVQGNSGSMDANMKAALLAYQTEVPLILAELDRLNTTVTTIHEIKRIYTGAIEGNVPTPEEIAAATAPTRHSGGPVMAGMPYRIRPEEAYLVPGSNGYVMPLSGGGAGIDYDRLAAALAKQPVVVKMNSRIVGEILRQEHIEHGDRNGGRIWGR